MVYLATGDYHRVHSPVAGQLGTVRKIEGDLYPVNGIGERHIPQLFVRNKRVVMPIENEGLGRVTAVMSRGDRRAHQRYRPRPPDVPPGEHTFRRPALGARRRNRHYFILVRPWCSCSNRAFRSLDRSARSATATPYSGRNESGIRAQG